MGIDGMSSDEEENDEEPLSKQRRMIREPFWRGQDANTMLSVLDTLDTRKRTRGRPPVCRLRRNQPSNTVPKKVPIGLPINFYSPDLDTSKLQAQTRLCVEWSG